MNGDLLLGLTRDGNKGLKVNETKQSPIAPRPGLIFEWQREGSREERTLLAATLPDGRFDVATVERDSP